MRGARSGAYHLTTTTTTTLTLTLTLTLAPTLTLALPGPSPSSNPIPNPNQAIKPTEWEEVWRWESTVKDCFKDNKHAAERREHEQAYSSGSKPPYLPSSQELRTLLTTSIQLGLPMLSTYAQDMLCLGFPTPPLWADEIAEMSEKERRLVEGSRKGGKGPHKA